MKHAIPALLCIAAIAVAIAAAGESDLPAPTSQPDAPATADLPAGRFRWQASAPLAAPVPREGQDQVFSVKDPSIVRYKDRWHLFVSVRGLPRTHAIEYMTFADWPDAAKAKHVLLPAYDGYWCAPQVFYFTPQKKWYLICQASNENWDPKYGPSFATNADIADPTGWSSPQRMDCPKTPAGKVGLDFWVICDDTRAHLFFTSLDGSMWRSETKLADFPAKWSTPRLALKGDVFEASHTYRLRGLNKYLTLIEAQNGHGWRYYKAYLADRLDGEWKPIAATRDQTFANMKNVTQPAGNHWTDSISHGELLRAGYDEKLDVDPADLRFVFQGALNKDRAGKPYGQIPWRLGLLTPAGGK